MTPEPLDFAHGRLRWLPPARAFELRAARGASPARLQGVEAIDRPGSVTPLNGGRLLWQRPRGWLAVADDAAWASSLQAMGGADTAALWQVFDVSAGRSAFLFEGPDVLQLLSRAGPAHVLPGSGDACTRLRLAQLSVLVETRRAGPSLQAVAWLESSLAAWWWSWWQAEHALEQER